MYNNINFDYKGKVSVIDVIDPNLQKELYKHLR